MTPPICSNPRDPRDPRFENVCIAGRYSGKCFAYALTHMISRLVSHSVFIAVVLFTGLAQAIAAPRPAKPNIVLILTDDLGWQDVKCYDIDEPSPMETPNIDELAKKGVMFWQAYSPAPTCGPSRCAIMSGTHPARAQMTHVSGGKPPRPHHRRGWNYLSPWYSARMPADEITLAKALKSSGYVTGHSGKWHMSKNHNSFPAATDQGFDFSRHSLGVQGGMPNRLTGFATRDPKDPFRLDENGYPLDQTTEDALDFLHKHNDQPFFLYYSTWLVHGPWQMRSERLLNKYVEKLGVELSEESRTSWKVEGQNNPFYCAMVELLDYYVGNLVGYLENTEDPRWPGHKLIENTYVIFSSDNGGMEGSPNEVATDNYPLDNGKISLMEGGTRVPLIVTGAGIPQGVQTDVMVNGLDFYPTILSLAGAKQPNGKHFDGCDLSVLLKKDPTDATLIREPSGEVRDTMVWHFPNSSAQESTIRVGDFKLVRNYYDQPELELYRLYKPTEGRLVRVDIEEAKNLAAALPEQTASMNRKLTQILTGMNASYPYFNPHCPRLPMRVKTPKVLSHRQAGDSVEFTYRENGAKVVRAELIYTKNGGHRNEEWFRAPARLTTHGTAMAKIPEGTSHYLLNLIDANNFLVSHPDIPDGSHMNKTKERFAQHAIKAAAAPRE
jgi:arylsulfatase A-like enzyme